MDRSRSGRFCHLIFHRSPLASLDLAIWWRSVPSCRGLISFVVQPPTNIHRCWLLTRAAILVRRGWTSAWPLCLSLSTESSHWEVPDTSEHWRGVPYAPATVGPLCFMAPPPTFFHYEKYTKLISDLKLNSCDVLPLYSLYRVSNTQPPSTEFN